MQLCIINKLIRGAATCHQLSFHIHTWAHLQQTQIQCSKWFKRKWLYCRLAKINVNLNLHYFIYIPSTVLCYYYFIRINCALLQLFIKWHYITPTGVNLNTRMVLIHDDTMTFPHPVTGANTSVPHTHRRRNMSRLPFINAQETNTIWTLRHEPLRWLKELRFGRKSFLVTTVHRKRSIKQTKKKKTQYNCYLY